MPVRQVAEELALVQTPTVRSRSGFLISIEIEVKYRLIRRDTSIQWIQVRCVSRMGTKVGRRCERDVPGDQETRANSRGTYGSGLTH